VPDGCVDLLWRDERFSVAGPDITAANPDLKPGTTVLGIRFKPGAATNWLGLPMTEITGSEVPMAELWGRKAADFAERIGEASTAREKLHVIQHLLADEVPRIKRARPDAAAIFEFLNSGTGTESHRIASLRDHLGLSERTLRRRCGEIFGYAPKILARILRFQRFQSLALTDAGEGLAMLALRAGYADQAHLGREIQSLCGMTAGEFVRQLTR
jgi:AraC-like DNA-binding protein